MSRPAPASTPHSRLTFLACRDDAREHEVATHRRLAAGLATLLGCRFEEVRRDAAAMLAAAGAPGSTGSTGSAASLGYVVPNETLGSLAIARALGITGEGDLFGGVVPFPFVATKTITHPLIAAGAAAPVGWNPEFAERVGAVVLPGFSAYSIDDAAIAGRRLLLGGDVRIKLASGIGGAGQSVACDIAQLDAQLAALDPGEIARQGLVIERNLAEVRTYSVGLLRVGTLQASYHGTQRNTLSRHGHEVYGGSTLTVVRGGLDALENRVLDADVRRTIGLARVYHAAALECFAGMYVSRCNYDVALGRDAAGREHAGVLEQSWRIGGASGAEVAALQALCDDPSLDAVRASTAEIHAADVVVPEGATLYFSGIDAHLGPITKYAWVHADADARAED